MRGASVQVHNVILYHYPKVHASLWSPLELNKKKCNKLKGRYFTGPTCLSTLCKYSATISMTDIYLTRGDAFWAEGVPAGVINSSHTLPCSPLQTSETVDMADKGYFLPSFVFPYLPGIYKEHSPSVRLTFSLLKIHKQWQTCQVIETNLWATFIQHRCFLAHQTAEQVK